MKFSVIVLHRGRPIARHFDLTAEERDELVQAYRAIGWDEDKILVEDYEAKDHLRVAA